MNKAASRRKYWISKYLKNLNWESFKTVSADNWKSALARLKTGFSDYFYEKFKKRWGREAFRVFHLKQKSFENFFNRMSGEKVAPKPIISYGAATIASSGKGEMSVPVKYILNANSTLN